jgi:hypothetical protein
MNQLIVAAVVLSAPLVPEADEGVRRLSALQGSWKLVRGNSKGVEFSERELRNSHAVIMFQGNAVTSHDGITKRGVVKVGPITADERAIWSRNTKHLGPVNQKNAPEPWAMDLGKEWSRATYQVRNNQLIIFFDFGLGSGEVAVFERE